MSSTQSNNIESLVVSKDTFNEIIQFKHEVLLAVNDALLHDEHLAVKNYLRSTPSSEVYYYLEFHQKIIINFLYFKDYGILNHYIQWAYKVSYFKEINLEIFSYQFKLWKEAYSHYLNPIQLLEIQHLYDYLIQHHDNFIKYAKQTVIQEHENPIVNQLFEMAIHSQKEKIVDFLKKRCTDINDFNTVFNEIIAQVMHQVGLMWEVSKLSVAKEHIASRTIEEACFEVINGFNSETAQDKTILLSNAPNEFHGMGLKILAKLLEKKGFKIIQLGSSGSPSEDINNAIKEFEPDYVLFSVSICGNLYDVAEIIKYLRKEIIPYHNLSVIIGGNAFQYLSNPKQSLNADHYCQYISETYTLL